MALDLNSLKEQIQAILQTANDAGATRDLSSGLANRVQRVLKINPNRIPVQADWYPYVTIFIDQKSVEMQDFGGSQMNAKRKGEISVKIAGVVVNSLLADAEVDEADDDCESLMENIEEILRANPQLGGSAVGSAVVGSSQVGPIVSWSYPTKVTYHNATLAEGVHIRAGMLDLTVAVFY